MNRKKSIHFVGIKGVGMTPLAIIAKQAGFTVTGCDVSDIFITDDALKKAGIHTTVGFSPDHIQDVDLVITTGAHGGYDNPEVRVAKEKRIPVMTQGEAVGEFMQGGLFGKKQKGISVAGCHGKTTTSAMIATVLTHAGFDPSYVIGTSTISPLGLPGHYGRGIYFIAEADEYANEPQYDKTPKFLFHKPYIAIITNIEHDHPDLYPTIESTRNAFLEFAHTIDQNGVLIACGDDNNTKKILEKYSGRRITYGFSSENDYVIKTVRISKGQTFFWVESNNLSLGEFTVKVLGEHNALNGLAAVITALECGISIEKAKKGLQLFTGTRRRLEYIGQLPSGASLFDDYAHHPTEIKKTLRAMREQYKKRKIICIFQPHTYSRTKLLFDEFKWSFINADEVIITNIYASMRETFDATISAQLLTQEMSKIHRQVLFLPELSNVVQYINNKQPGEDTIILTMGAGDVYKIGESLMNAR